MDPKIHEICATGPPELMEGELKLRLLNFHLIGHHQRTWRDCFIHDRKLVFISGDFLLSESPLNHHWENTFFFLNHLKQIYARVSLIISIYKLVSDQK